MPVVVTAGNRNGLTVAISAAIVNAVRALGHDCVLDGEATGDVYWPFDLLSFDGNDVAERSRELPLPTAHRHAQGQAIKSHRTCPHRISEDEKHALLQTIKTEHGEGIVFKNAKAGILRVVPPPAEMP